MISKKIKKLYIVVTLILMCYTILNSNVPHLAYAQTSYTNGTYMVAVSNDMPMGKDNIAKTALLEVQGEVCYLSLAFNTEKLANVKLEISGKTVGRQIIEKSGGLTTYCYTLSKSSILLPLLFVADVVPMGQDGLNRKINVTVNLSSTEKLSEFVKDRGERPAEFVPLLMTNAGGEYLQEKGTFFTIPAASASLGDAVCDVDISAYYLNEGKRQAVVIENNRIRLENVGEYFVVYRASCADYKTSSGADTYTEYTVKIVSGIDVSPLATLSDINNILPDGVTLQASRIESGALYDAASERMKTIADRYEVFDISLYDEEGYAVELTNTVLIGVLKDSEYINKETDIYYLSETGMLGKLSCTEMNGYAEFETDRLGTFIICIPGVIFVMPIWGYAAILVACVFLVIIVALVTVFLVRRKKRKSRQNL